MANVRVALRVRPLSKREHAEGARIIVNVEETIAKIRNAKLEYRPDGCGDTRECLLEFGFDYCYWSVDPDDPKYASQEVIFQDLGTSVLSEALKGYNVCLFAYGQTGSGKTYTMMGTPSSVGLTPRICEGLFCCDDGSPGSPSSYRIEVSFLEIYNERVRDLLNQPEQKKPYTLRVREHPEKGPYVQGLSQHVVTSYEQVVALLQEGMQNRITAATHVHDASSRSHAIFTIQYTQAMLEDNLPSEIASKINLVDLAGSERASPNYCKDRLTEGSNINRSLVTLGIVISALAQNSQMTSSCQSINSIASDGDSGITCSPSGGSMNGTKRQPYIPYRDSILTWLLKDSLGGNSKTIMIATVSPSSSSYNETMSTLRYASNAKNIINKPRVNEDASVKLIRDLREEINRLKNMLRNFEMRTISPSFNDGREGNLTEIVLQNELKIEQFTKAWTDKWSDKAAIMEQYNVDINKGRAGVTIDSSLPHLVAMDDDILSTGVVIYQLREGTTKIGRIDSDQDQDIVLQGETIENEHCVISNHCGTVELQPCPGAYCTVNGQDVVERCRLSQGAVIVLGRTHQFRFNHPAEAAILRQRRSDTKASFLSSGSLDWLDLSGDFSTSSDENSLFLNESSRNNSLNEEYQQKLRDLETTYQQQVEEQQHYVEELKKQIQAAQIKSEKELDDEQSLINQLIKDNQQWLVKETQCLTTDNHQLRESAAQTEHEAYSEAQVENPVQSNIQPAPVEQDKKRLVQLELLCKCSLRRAERNIKRKKVKFQLERIIKKQKLLEARRNLQELQDVCWIKEDRVKPICHPHAQGLTGHHTTLTRSRSSPSGFAYYRRCSAPWASLATYSADQKRKNNKSEETALLHNFITTHGNKPRRSASVECLPKILYNNSSRGDSDHEQTYVSASKLHRAVKHLSESSTKLNKTGSCFGGAALITNYPQISVKRQNMDKAGIKSKGLAINNPVEFPKKKNVRINVKAVSKETKSKPVKSPSPQSAGGLKNSNGQEMGKAHQKNDSSKCHEEIATKNPQKNVTLENLRFGKSSSTVKNIKKETESSSPNTQKKSTEITAKISSSVENINKLGRRATSTAIDRRWQSTERLSKGFLKPTTELLENCKEDDESGSSDSESYYSVDSLSSAYASALNEQLKIEERERNKNDHKGSDSEDSQMSQDSLVERESQKRKPNKRTFHKYKTILTPHSYSTPYASEQISSPLVKSGSFTSGLSKAFSLDSLADAEEVPDADSAEEMPAEIFWKLQSPTVSVSHGDDQYMVDVTQKKDCSGLGIRSSFYLNGTPDKMLVSPSRASTSVCDIQHDPVDNTILPATAFFSPSLGAQKRNPKALVDDQYKVFGSLEPSIQSIPKRGLSLNKYFMKKTTTEDKALENAKQQFAHFPKSIIMKSTNDTKLFEGQEEQQSLVERINNNGDDRTLSMPNKNQKTLATKAVYAEQESTLEKMVRVYELLNVAAGPGVRESPKESYIDQNITQTREQSICSDTDLQSPIYDIFTTHCKESQKCFKEDYILPVCPDLNEQQVRPHNSNHIANEDILAGFDDTTCLADIPRKVDIESAVNVLISCGKDTSSCAEDNYEKQLATKTLILEKCETMSPNHCSTVNVNRCLCQISAVMVQSHVCSCAENADQNEKFETKEISLFPVIQGDQETHDHYCSDTVPEVLDTNQNVTLPLALCAVLKDNNYSETFQISTCSESALSNEAQKVNCESYQENLPEANHLPNNSVENNENKEPDSLSCDLERPADRIQSTASLLVNEESSDLCIGSCKTERDQKSDTIQTFTIMPDDSKNTSIQWQDIVQNHEIVTMACVTIVSDAASTDVFCQQLSLLQKDKNPPLLSESVTVQNMEATKINIQSTIAPNILTTQPCKTSENLNCTYPESHIIDNVQDEGGRKVEMNPVLTMDDNLMKSMHNKGRTESLGLTESEISIISNLNENPDLLLISGLCGGVTGLSSNDIANFRLLKGIGITASQGFVSAKNMVNICIEPDSSTESDTRQDISITPVVKPILQTQEVNILGSFEEFSDRVSMQSDVDLSTHNDIITGRVEADVLCEKTYLLQKHNNEQICLTDSVQVMGLCSMETQDCLLEEGIISAQHIAKICPVNELHVPGGESVLDHDENRHTQALPETHSAASVSEKKFSLDQLNSLLTVNTKTDATEHSSLQTSDTNLFISKSVGEKDCIPIRDEYKTDIIGGLHRCISEINNVSQNLDKDNLETQTFVCGYEQQDPSNLEEPDIQFSEIVSSRTDGTAQIQESGCRTRGNLHLPRINGKEETTCSYLLDLQEANDQGSIRHSNCSKFQLETNVNDFPTRDHNESGENPDEWFLGLNSASNALQTRLVYAENIAASGLVLPYYEAILQKNILCSTALDTERNIMSISSNMENNVLKSSAATKEPHEDSPVTNSISIFYDSGFKPLQENCIVREAFAEPPTAELSLSTNPNMILEPHHVIHKIGNAAHYNPGVSNGEQFAQSFCAGAPELNSTSQYTSELSSEECVSRSQVGTNLSAKLKFSQSQADNEQLLSASVHSDRKVCNETRQEENILIHKGDLFVQETMKGPYNESLSGFWQQCEGNLTNIVNKQTDDLLSLKRESTDMQEEYGQSAYVFQNPEPIPDKSEAAYSIFTSVNEHHLQSSTIQSFSAQCCIPSNKVQIAHNNNFVQESQEEVEKKDIVNKLHLAIGSNKLAISGSNSGINMNCKPSSSYQIYSQRQTQVTLSGDIQELNKRSSSAENMLQSVIKSAKSEVSLNGSKENVRSLYNQPLMEIDTSKVKKVKIGSRKPYDAKRYSAIKDNEVASNMTSEVCLPDVVTLHENAKAPNQLALNDEQRIACLSLEEQHTHVSYEVVGSADNCTTREEEVNTLSASCEALMSSPSNLKVSDAHWSSGSKARFQDHKQNGTCSDNKNPRFEKLTSITALTQSLHTDTIFSNERRDLSSHYDKVHSESKASCKAENYKTPSSHPNLCANCSTKPMVSPPCNTSLINTCIDKEVEMKAYLKSRSPKNYRNTTIEELPQEPLNSDRDIVGNIDDLHFSSSDINPFIHQWQAEDSPRVGWKQYAFSSASDVSCSKFPIKLKADKLIRCSSVDEGLNSHNSPFHSHLSTYANARVISSNFSSFDDLQTVGDTMQERKTSHDGSLYYYPLSGEPIGSHSKDDRPFGTNSTDFGSKANCSMQVDEIMLLYESDSETSNENNLRVTFEQGTQTESKQKRVNRHQRSQTDVSSVRRTRSKTLYPRPASWSNVQNMSLHLSQLLHETSELLGNLSQHHVVEHQQGSSVEQGETTEAVSRIVRDSSTQTTVDIGIQTDLQTQNQHVQNQAEEQNRFLNSPEINVILKVIGTDSLPQKYSDLAMKQNGLQSPKTITQSLPNLNEVDHFDKTQRLLGPSPIRASTPLLDGAQVAATPTSFSTFISRFSPGSPIMDKDKEESSSSNVNTLRSSISHNSSDSSEQKEFTEENRENLACRGNTIMVDRASSPILTLKASKKPPIQIIPEQSLNSQNILKILRHRRIKAYDSHEPQVENSSQTETDSESASSQSSSKKVQKSYCLSRFKDPPRRLVSEDSKLSPRFRSANCILKDKHPLGLHRSCSTSEVSGPGRPSSVLSYLGLERPDNCDKTSVTSLNTYNQNSISFPWERSHSLESLSQILQARCVPNRISHHLSSTPIKDQCNNEHDNGSIIMTSNNSYLKNKSYTFLASETSGFGLCFQADDEASIAESECNTEVLLTQDPTSRVSHRTHNYTLQDLPLHNKFSNWSGVYHSPSRTGSLLGTSTEPRVRASPTKTESSQTCDINAGEIERLQRERAEIMSGLHLEMTQQPLTVQLAEAKLNYGIGETDALLRVLQSGKGDNQDVFSMKKQLYERHMKVIESLRKEREGRLQIFRRSRSLSPMKQLSESQASLTSLRESDSPSRRREYLQQLRKNVVDNTRIQEPKKSSTPYPSEIELMLKDYQKAREEAKSEIARARDKLRERAEVEKRRLQHSCQSKEDLKIKTLLSTNTLCTSSLISLSSGPTSGYNSSITVTRDKTTKAGIQETKTSARNVDMSAGSTRGRSGVRNSHNFEPSQESELIAREERWMTKPSAAASKTQSSYVPYNSSIPSNPVSYQEFARQVQASATAEVLAAGSNDLKNLFCSRASSGWKYQCTERDVQVYYKAFPSATKHGFLGAGIIRRPLNEVWCMVKDINTRHLYDQSILNTQVHQRVGNSIQLVHVMSDMSLCYLKQPRDFCCISVESKEEKQHSLCFQSLYNEAMPRPSKDTVRGEILPSAWILQSDTINGEEITEVIYMLQVDLGAPAIPLRLLGVVTKRQPLVIASLARFLSK